MLYWNKIINDLAKILTWFCSTHFKIYSTKLQMFYVWALLSHDRIQYDSLILSKQNWAYPHQHLQQLLWCQGCWRSADVTNECLKTNFHLSSTPQRKLCVHYANGFDNVESVYLFYSNPVLSSVTCRLYSIFQFLINVTIFERKT
jgi:hypothetical protein